ncbi:hypothetical protein Tco_1289950, partial [Tanacetum coccineum]
YNDPLAENVKILGMDYAGIATQVWKWKDEHGGTILKQLWRLGPSLD